MGFTLPLILVVKLIIFYYLGQCHRGWYSVSFSDLVMLFHSATLSLLCVAAIDKLFVQNSHPPRGVLLLDYAMTILVLGGLRGGSHVTRGAQPPFMEARLSQGADRGGQSVGRNARASIRSPTVA